RINDFDFMRFISVACVNKFRQIKIRAYRTVNTAKVRPKFSVYEQPEIIVDSEVEIQRSGVISQRELEAVPHTNQPVMRLSIISCADIFSSCICMYFFYLIRCASAYQRILIFMAFTV